MYTKNSPELKLRILWLLIGYALVALVIFMSLSSDPVDMGISFQYQDKVSHAFAYFTLMFWFSQIYHDRFRRYIIAFMFVALGVVLEWLQSFDPQRMTEFADMLANTTGVALGFFLALTNAKNCLLRIEQVIN